MGNAIQKADEAKARKRQEIFAQNLRDSGMELPDANTTKVPDFATKGDAVAWMNVALAKLSNAQKVKLYQQPFRIGTGEPLSYIDRKKRSIIDSENPFETTQSEAEDVIFKKIGEKVKDVTGLRRGGHVPVIGKKAGHHFF